MNFARKIFFSRATNFVTKNAPKFSPKFLSLCSVGQKKSRKIPSKFPAKFSKFPCEIKKKKFTDELLQERREPKRCENKRKSPKTVENMRKQAKNSITTRCFTYRNCLKHVQSNLVPSRLLPNSCLLNPGRGPKSNRTSQGFSQLIRLRNTENLVNPFVWTWTWLKHFQT